MSKLGMDDQCEGEDRISALTDDLIHLIFSLLEVKDVVRTSVLSTRWKDVWKHLPFCNFAYDSSIAITVNNFLATRNQQSKVLALKFDSSDVCSARIIAKIVDYASSHGCEDISLRSRGCGCSLSLFNSLTLQKLRLTMNLDQSSLNQWNLPSLHTLHLEHFFPEGCYRRLPDLFSFLPSLSSLTIVRVSLPVTFALRHLKSLIIVDCEMSDMVWELPALITLKLVDLHLPFTTLSRYLPSLVHLEQLTLIWSSQIHKDCLITCPHLVNLEVETKVMAGSNLCPHFLVLSPHITKISVRGMALITCGALELGMVNVILRDCILDKTFIPKEMLETYFCKLFPMFSGLGAAKILEIDYDTFEALSTVSNYLEHLPSPFHNLNCVKLPQRCNESGMPAALRNYLLGGTPGATFVTEIPQAQRLLEEANKNNHEAEKADNNPVGIQGESTYVEKQDGEYVIERAEGESSIVKKVREIVVKKQVGEASGKDDARVDQEKEMKWELNEKHYVEINDRMDVDAVQDRDLVRKDEQDGGGVLMSVEVTNQKGVAAATKVNKMKCPEKGKDKQKQMEQPAFPKIGRDSLAKILAVLSQFRDSEDQVAGSFDQASSSKGYGGKSLAIPTKELVESQDL